MPGQRLTHRAQIHADFPVEDQQGLAIDVELDVRKWREIGDIEIVADDPAVRDVVLGQGGDRPCQLTVEL
jgi:hypothetical protein